LKCGVRTRCGAPRRQAIRGRPHAVGAGGRRRRPGERQAPGRAVLHENRRRRCGPALPPLQRAPRCCCTQRALPTCCCRGAHACTRLLRARRTRLRRNSPANKAVLRAPPTLVCKPSCARLTAAAARACVAAAAQRLCLRTTTRRLWRTRWRVPRAAAAR
jgi:hypothetical protein